MDKFDKLALAEKNEELKINKNEDLLNDQFGVKPLELQKKNQFDYELPPTLKNYLIEVKGKENYAKNLLKDNFAEANKQYASSEQFQKDQETYSDITGGKNVNITYKDQMKMEHRLSSQGYSDMVADSKTFVKIASFGLGGDSKSMEEIKKRVNILQDFLAGGMEKFKAKDNVTYDADKFGAVVNDLFEGALDACNNYINTHRKEPHTPWGARRLRKVRDIQRQLDLDFIKYREAVDVLAANAYDSSQDLSSPLDLVEKEDFVEITEAQHQTEGNSTEVYLVKVISRKMVEGKMVEEIKEYYMKENLPLINKDMDGFLERRKNELEASLGFRKEHEEAKKKGQDVKSKEEFRMQKSNTDETDYQNGIEFLQILQNSIKNSNNTNTKASLRNEYALLFKHDFDRIFRELKEYNGAIEYFEEYKKKDLKVLMEEAKTDPQAKVVYEILSKAKNKGVDKVVKPKEKTPAEWVVEKLNIKDKNIIDFFKKLQNQPTNYNMREADPDKKNRYVDVSRIEALFRVTMGKEVELYGQIMEKDKIEDNEMSQYNTMATSYIADNYGFQDEIVSTQIKKSQFMRWDNKISRRTVTLQDVAKGKEWIDVIKEKKKTGGQIKLHMNAVRQLMRLYVNDTLTQQKDRHGRNFKCETQESARGWRSTVVKKIKAYDHDQSCTTGDLKVSFEEERDANNKLTKSNNNRFLPPMQRVIKKNSPMYNYILNKYFNANVLDKDWMKKEKQNPLTDVRRGSNDDEDDDDYHEYDIKLNAIKKDLLLTTVYGHKKTVNEVHGKKYYSADVTGSVELVVEKTNPEDKTSTQVAPNSVILKRGNERLERAKGAFDANKVLYGGERKNGNIPVYTECRRKSYRDEWETTYNPEGKAIIQELTEIIRTLSDFFIREDINSRTGDMQRRYGWDEKISSPYNVQLYFKSGDELNKSPKLEQAARAIKRLKILNTKYDFSEVLIQHSGMVDVGTYPGYNFKPGEDKGFYNNVGAFVFSGLLQGWIDSTLKMFADSFANNETVQRVMDEVEGDLPEDLMSLVNANGDLVIPNMLHMDYKAYMSIKEIVAGFGPNGTLASELKKKHLSDAAIESIKIRAEQMIDRIDHEVKPAAEVFLNRMYKEGDPRRKFFLETEEDYNRFDSLYDFAIDPGDTYLVQDNKHFLACNEEYAQFLTDAEKQQILNMRNDTVKDKKRWNLPKGESRLETVISDKIEKGDY